MTLALFSVGKTAKVIHGDSADVLPTFAVDSIDAIVTDPPAGIGFMGKTWDGDRGGRDEWISWLASVMRECLRVLKPGGHALVWALPRTSHWTATAIEDAGFEIRDVHHHLFGTGFPKSHNVSKAIDAKLGAKRQVVGSNPNHRPVSGIAYEGIYSGSNTGSATITAPTTPEAIAAEGLGTALKPAVEHWILARKPLDGTVAENVMTHGTGGLRIDDCRIEGAPRTTHSNGNRQGTAPQPMSWDVETRHFADGATGRWPAHLSLDEYAAAVLDEQSGELTGAHGSRGGYVRVHGNVYGKYTNRTSVVEQNSGGASRFFYVSKASSDEKTASDRVDNDHPTVKSIALMTWLVRLITPVGGLVLDPFAGSGTTGVACASEGLSFIGIEADPKYHALATQRLMTAYGSVTP